jgi:hypothetical protein
MEELLALGVTSQIHYLSIKRGIQVLRQSKFNPQTMVCRAGSSGLKIRLSSAQLYLSSAQL